MSPLGIAVVGVGDVAQRDYLPEFHRLGGRARLVTVMSRQADRARSVAAAFGAARWTTSLDEALGDDVDVVVNLTPAAAHLEVSLAAIGAGKHLYTEKPLGRSPAEGAQIDEAAALAGVSVAAAPSVAVFPQMRWLAGVLGDGALGEVVSVHAHASGGVPPWPGYESDPTHFFAADSGPLRDMGVYPLHAAVELLSPVAYLYAYARHTVDGFVIEDGPFKGRRVPMDAPDTWSLTARLHGGVTLAIDADFSTREPAAPEFEVRGREGTAAISLLDVAAPVRLLARGSDTWHEHTVDHDREGGPDHILGVADLLDHLLTGSALHIGLGTARHVLDVIEAAETSAATGTGVTVAAAAATAHASERTTA